MRFSDFTAFKGFKYTALPVCRSQPFTVLKSLECMWSQCFIRSLYPNTLKGWCQSSVAGTQMPTLRINQCVFEESDSISDALRWYLIVKGTTSQELSFDQLIHLIKAL